jgi:endonuclease-3
MERKQPFDIDDALRRIEEVVRPFPKAALFELAARGFSTPFQQLVACIISIRTRDEDTLPIAIRLLTRAGTPAEMLQLTSAEIEELIEPSSFRGAKAPQILTIARRLVDDFAGELPCDGELMQSFAGVGPKCANLTLGIACGQRRVSVDVHVHRVTNRWGYVHAATPEQSMLALEATLPECHWIDINRLLVPFGKHICTGRAPRCSICPVLDMCRQVGVTSHR